MKGLKNKLFIMVNCIGFIIILIIIIYNINYLKLRNQFYAQTNYYNLKISVEFVENTMENIENTLIIEGQKNVDLKKIIKSRTNVEREFSYMKMKEKFKKEIKKQNSLDGFFLYDSLHDVYVGEVGKNVTSDIHQLMKNNIAVVIKSFDYGQIGNKWTSIELQGRFYLVRMIKIKTLYLCTWIKPENLLQRYPDEKLKNTYYVLCDKNGLILTQKNFPLKKITENYVIYNQDKYRIFQYDFQKRDFSMRMLVKELKTENFQYYIFNSIFAVVCIGIFILILIWGLMKQFFLEPVDLIVLKKTIEKNEATLQFMQLQLNPHFLNNCLSLIRSLILFEKYDQAEEAVLALSEFTRRSIQPDTMITIEKELTQIRAWYELQKFRVENGIEVLIEIDDGVEEEKIPAMLIYSFVENAAKHFGKRKEKIKIKIIVKYSEIMENYLEIMIEDNGCGFSEEILSKLKNNQEIIDKKGMKHIGIHNVIQRLNILYDMKANIEIKNGEKQGAQVRIFVPVQEEIEE